MTAEKLQDAITGLPMDLVTATDRLRTAPRAKVIPLRRWVSLAAVLILVVGTTLVFRKEILPGLSGASEAAPQAPAAAAPEIMKESPAAEAAPMAPAADAPIQEVPAAEDAVQDSAASTTTENGAGTAGGSHRHSYAEPEETVQEPIKGYCGNTLTTVYLEEMNFTLAGTYSIAITDILINLDYDPDQVCRCVAEFTVDTETLAGIEVNLTEGFARCELGQAALTEEQAQTMAQIIENLN